MFTRILLLLALSVVFSATAGVAQTFVPAPGALPWNDRAEWTFATVPESAKGGAAVPQQACGSRAVMVTGAPTAIVVGVYEKDAPAFEALSYPAPAAVQKTSETFTLKNTAGTILNYVVYRITSPPAKVGGGLAVGMVLLKVEGGDPSAVAVAPVPAPTPVPSPAPTPAAAGVNDPGSKTFIPAPGALPWFDRADWTLASVPDSAKSGGPVPQQACSTHSLALTGQPKTVVVGVYEKDVPAFEALSYPAPYAAQKTGETFTVKNATGVVLNYAVYRVTAPPEKIGPVAAGMILLKVEEGAASATGAATPNLHVPVPFENGDAKKLHLFLLIGQSNMLGRDATGIDAQVPDPRVGSYNAAGQWVVAVEPIYTGGNGFGPGTFFAQAMLAAEPGTKVGLIPCAVGGTPLSRWVKGGDLYENAIRRAKAASAAGVLAGVLWHQGESDSMDAALANSYEARVTQMFADLRTDLGAPSLPIVVGQLGDFLQLAEVETVRAAIKKVGTTVPNVGYAEAQGLVDKGDHLHFTVDSQKMLGAHYATAMEALLKAQGMGIAAVRQ